MAASLAYQAIPDQKIIGLCVASPKNNLECGHRILFYALVVIPKGLLTSFAVA
jgi:hypothetical protein